MLHAETGTIIKSGGQIRVCLIFPNTYRVAASNLGFQTIYRELNSRPDTRCERGFLDPVLELKSLESGTPFAQFDILAFSVAFELDFLGLAKVLVDSRLPLLSRERNSSHPLIVLGGACATSNPEPVADFVDVVVVGEGEHAVHRLTDHVLLYGADDRAGLLRDLAGVSGFYVPRFVHPVYATDGTIVGVEREVPRGKHFEQPREELSVPAFSQVITPHAEFPNMFLIEVSRGCIHSCRFCLTRKIYPYRVWPASKVLEIVDAFCPEGTARIGLVGAAVSDHPEIDEIAVSLVARDKRISPASLRVDLTSQTFLRALAESGQRTVTFAPEVGTDRLGRVIGKSVAQELLLEKVDTALAVGLKNIRLYFMLGLPSEDDDDVAAIVELAAKVADLVANRTRARGRLSLSISPFVPKPLTPFERVSMERTEILERRYAMIKSGLSVRRDVTVKFESIRLAVLQALFARGDRRLGEPIALMVREGMSYKRAMHEAGLHTDFYLYRRRSRGETLPWRLCRA